MGRQLEVCRTPARGTTGPRQEAVRCRESANAGPKLAGASDIQNPVVAPPGPLATSAAVSSIIDTIEPWMDPQTQGRDKTLCP